MTGRQLQAALKRMWKRIEQRPQTPAGTAGRVSITTELRPKDSRVTVCSLRNSILQGVPQATVPVTAPLIIRTLSEKGHGVWMTDSPQEIFQMDVHIRAARGRVLVVGLGLGVVAHLIAQKPTVSACVCVERSQDIIKLVQPYISEKVTVVHDDIYKFAERDAAGNDFNYAFADTWQGTGEGTWRDEVVPLFRLLGRAGIKRIEGWNIQEMAGQFTGPFGGLWRALSMSEEQARHWKPYWCFYKAMADKKLIPEWAGACGQSIEAFVKNAEFIKKNPALLSRARLYCLGVGTKQWEAVFGRYWDEYDATS